MDASAAYVPISRMAAGRRNRRKGSAGCAFILLTLLAGCTAADIYKIQIAMPPDQKLLGFRRVLIAGFLADRSDQMDLNEETARFLRTRLRSETSLSVMESEPLDLAAVSPLTPRQLEAPAATFEHSNLTRGTDSIPFRADDAVFANLPFWRRLGEEYLEPLIVTGTVLFEPAAARLEQRQIGRRTIYVWHRGFSLTLRLIMINGQTGEIINSVALRKLTAHAATAREGELSLYFRLMERTMPSVLDALGPQTNRYRVLLK